MIEITNEDCMDLMARYPDKYFQLAIVDPPYGDADGSAVWDSRGRLPPAGRGKKYVTSPPPPDWTNRERGRFGTGRFAKYKVARTGGKCASKYGKAILHWDVAPEENYFEELFRVAEKVIVWGGNYFNLPPSRNFIIWKKLTISETFTMAMAEYAWTNIPGNAKVIECAPQDKKRFHPTQKPVYLYKKLLQWYAKAGDRVLDTHLGSGSSAIACIEAGLDFTGCEIDPDYFGKAMARVKECQAQKELFDAAELLTRSKTLFEENNL